MGHVIMNSLARRTFIAAAIAFAGLSHAGDTTTYPAEYWRHIQQRSLIQAAQDQFGDRVDLNSGSLEIVQTDVVLPGIGPDMRVGRRYRPSDAYGEGLFRYWDIDLPHIHGTFSASVGWPGWGARGARCSQFSAPPDVVVQGGSFSADEYWSGSFLYLPGEGEQELLERAGAPAPNDGKVYPVVTKSGNAIRCVPLAQTSESSAVGGEGFEVVDTKGTIYTLNQYVSRYERTLSKSYPDPVLSLTAGAVGSSGFGQLVEKESASIYNFGNGGNRQLSAGYNLPRKEILLYPTRVTDRFGNSVTISPLVSTGTKKILPLPG